MVFLVKVPVVLVGRFLIKSLVELLSGVHLDQFIRQ